MCQKAPSMASFSSPLQCALKIRVWSVSLLLVCLKKVPNLHGVCLCVSEWLCNSVCVCVCHCFQKSEKSFQVGGENVILQGEESELPASLTYILIFPRGRGIEKEDSAAGSLSENIYILYRICKQSLLKQNLWVPRSLAASFPAGVAEGSSQRAKVHL